MRRTVRSSVKPVLRALVVAAAVAPTLSAAPLAGQEARPDDVASPEAIVAAAYAAIARPAGETYDWDRFRTLFHPSAQLIPSTEQRGGALDVLSVEGFIEWIEAGTQVGGPDDQGFSEDGIHDVVERYGDIAHVFSTYEKHLYGQTENLGRGINTFQMVFNDGRWWILSIAWDEEIGAGPIPDTYLP